MKPADVIQSHLYTNKEGTGLYPGQDGQSDPICALSLGIWLGELERQGEWIRVIGVQGEGWVKAEDVETKSPFNLHAHWTPGKPIEYVSTAA